MNKFKVLIGSLLVLATMFLSTYALSSPLPHPVCMAALNAPSQVTAGQAATIDASSSFCFISGSSLRVPITNYVFNFGDGKSFSGTTPVVSHFYTSVGTYHPSVIVSAQGWQSTASATLNVVQPAPYAPQVPIIYIPQPSMLIAPTVNLTCGGAGMINCGNTPPFVTSFNADPRFGPEPLTVTFTGSATDVNGDPLTYILFFDWNNNESLNKTGVINATESIIGAYTYNAGMYQTKMYVSDGKNKSSRTVTIHVNTTVPSNEPPVACFTASETAGYLPFTATFDGSCSNDPDGTIESYSWEILKKDNGRPEEQNGTGTPGALEYTFTEEGYYFVYLTVWDNQGESNQMNLTVHTEQLPLSPPIIGWYRTEPANGYAPLTVNFKGSAVGIYPLTYVLYISTSDQAKTITGVINSTDSMLGTWTYITGGTFGKYYTSELVVTDPLNKSRSKQFSTFVAPAWTNPNATGNHAPLVGFAYEPAEALVNQEVQFTDTSTDSDGSVIYWIWNFGDGTHSGDDLLSGEQNPKHIYTSVGNYSASLKVYDNKGFSNYTAKTVEVKEKVTPPGNEIPIVSFSYEPSEIFVGDSAQFNDTSYDSDGSVLTWAWSFGDGTTSDVQNPAHSYSSMGNYTVALTVYDDLNAQNTTSKTIEVKVRPPQNQPPVACMTASDTGGYLPFTITFDGSCSYDPDSAIVYHTWRIEKENGPVMTEVEGNGLPGTWQYTFTEQGKYFVYLKVTDEQNESNETNVTIKAEQYLLGPVIGWFRGEPSSGYAPLTVSFKSSAVGIYPLTYTLFFSIDDRSKNVTGAINSTDSILGNFLYISGGTFGKTYQAELMVTDSMGKSVSKMTDIHVSPAWMNPNSSTNLPPQIGFGYSPPEIFVGDQVQFTDQSIDTDGHLIYWIWQFGDGSGSGDDLVSGEQNPTHIYSTAGNYNVTLKVYDNQGFSNLTRVELAVKERPLAPQPPSGGGGGGGGGMYLTQPAPIKKTSGITYLGFHPSFALNGTRTYSYDPSTNTTTIVFKLTNLARLTRLLSIRDLITKDMATSMMDVQVIPVPTNLYNMDPDIGWNVTLGSQETFTAKYVFSRYIPFISFDAMPLPKVTELQNVSGAPTEVPVSPTTKVTAMGGITGFVITTLSNPWAGVVIAIVILVLFFVSTETGRETWNKIATKTGNFVSSIAEELEEPKEYKRDRGERVKRLKKLMKKKRR